MIYAAIIVITMLRMSSIFLDIEIEVIGLRYRYGGCAFGRANMLRGGHRLLFTHQFYSYLVLFYWLNISYIE